MSNRKMGIIKIPVSDGCQKCKLRKTEDVPEGAFMASRCFNGRILYQVSFDKTLSAVTSYPNGEFDFENERADFCPISPVTQTMGVKPDSVFNVDWRIFETPNGKISKGMLQAQVLIDVGWIDEMWGCK